MERGDGKFSPDFSAKLMALFENYYGIEYSLPKMDKISIPDYSSGGKYVANCELVKILVF